MRAEGAAPERGGRNTLAILLWLIVGVFLTLMIVTWVAAERADPVLLDLETGQPMQRRPAL